MQIINKASRLIDFKWEDKKYRLMPAGKAVNVPGSAVNSQFLNALLDSGDVAKVGKEKEDTPKVSKEKA